MTFIQIDRKLMKIPISLILVKNPTMINYHDKCLSAAVLNAGQHRNE